MRAEGERPARKLKSSEEEASVEEEFNPSATIVLMIGYILIFALAWGSVYFFELIGRR